VVGDGLTVIDYERMTLIPMSVSATHLLEVVESYDGRALVLRHFDYVEKLSMAGPEKGKVLVSNVVDSAPDVASLDSTHRLTFAPDGASLFFVRAAKSGSELVTLSSEDLRVETRSPIGPYPSAISAVPDRHWVLVTTGFAGNEQLEALDTIKHAVVFRAILPGGSTSPTKSLGAC
jgi:hypothetical protein